MKGASKVASVPDIDTVFGETADREWQNKRSRWIAIHLGRKCRGEGSNLHGLLHMLLRHARLPISPPRQKIQNAARSFTANFAF